MDKDFPLIIITNKEELAQYGLDAAKFRRYGRDEWHGPCPHCGGDDRLIVSNGFVRCRQGLHRWTNNQHRETSGIPLAWLNPDVQQDPEQLARQLARIEEEERQEELKRQKRIYDLTASKVWLQYHNQLLYEHPEQIEWLAEDGIDMRCIESFLIGYDDEFHWWKDNVETVSPSLTFPIMRKTTIMEKEDWWCVNIRHRLLVQGLKGDKYRPHKKGLGYYYLRGFIKGQQSLIVVEGEKKAIVLWKHGLSAAGLPGVESLQEDWIQEIKVRFPENRFVIFDHEDEEKDPTKAERIWKRAQNTAFRLDGIAIQLPKVGKIDDQLNNGELSKADLTQLLSMAAAQKTGIRLR